MQRHHHHPPAPDSPPAPLLYQIERDFGSVEDFRRTLHHMLRDKRGGYVNLVCSPGGRLRLVRTPVHVMPRGNVLLRLPAQPSLPPPRPDWGPMADRFNHHMQHRPPYPMP